MGVFGYEWAGWSRSSGGRFGGRCGLRFGGGGWPRGCVWGGRGGGRLTLGGFNCAGWGVVLSRNGSSCVVSGKLGCANCTLLF